MKEILEERILVDAASDGNRWMASWAFWLLKRRDMAVRALIVRFIPKKFFIFHNLLTGFPLKKSPVESLLPPTPASPSSAGEIALHAKSFLSNDPALVVLYRQLREKTVQTIKGAVKVPPRDEWNFILRNARLYDRMGCDLLALNLVAEWEFFSQLPAQKPPQTEKRVSFELKEETPNDLRKLLKRRSSLVVTDVPASQGLQDELRDAINPKSGTQNTKPQKRPTGFHEPDANSLLDSFGF